MNTSNILRILSYFIASTLLIAGIIILTGFLVPSYLPQNYRIISGIIMILYGSFRIVMLRIQQRNVEKSQARNQSGGDE